MIRLESTDGCDNLCRFLKAAGGFIQRAGSERAIATRKAVGRWRQHTTIPERADRVFVPIGIVEPAGISSDRDQRRRQRAQHTAEETLVGGTCLRREWD